MKNNLFAIEHESFAIDLFVNRYFTEEQEITINPETNPDQKAFIDFNFDVLNNYPLAIKFNEDYTFISGNISLELAKSLFGSSVCDTEQTQYIIAYLVREKLNQAEYDIDFNLEFEFITESVACLFDREYKTAADVQQLINDTVELIEGQKNNQPLDDFKPSVELIQALS